MKQRRIKKEQWTILCVWVIFLLVLPIILIDWTRISDASDIWRGFTSTWFRILPFLLLYILHHDGLMRWYPRKKGWYFTGLAVLMLLFGAWQFVDPHRPGPPHDPPGAPPAEFSGNPSHEMRPADTPPDSLAGPPPAFDRPGGPPFDRPDGPHHPLGREVSLILLGLLMVSGDFAGTLYGRKRRIEESSGTTPPIGNTAEALPNGDTGHPAPERTAPAPRELYFMSDYHRVKVLVEDILYIQSMGEYIKIYRRSDAMPLITLYGIARLASELPEGQFVRIHRSYIVARSAIEKTSRSEVILAGGTTLPVGATYKDALSTKV